MDHEHDRALFEAIATIRDMAPDVKENLKAIATLTEKMANVESNSAKLFDMLLGFQKTEQEMRQARLKLWLGFLAAALTTLANLGLAYFTYSKH